MRVRLLAIAAVLAVLAAMPAGAAAEGHVRQKTITSKFPNPSLKDACGVALSGGRAYVSNYYEHAVFIFVPDSNGDYQYATQLNIQAPPLAETGKPFAGPCDLALDSEGNLYVNNWHTNVVRFAPTPPGATTYGPGVVIDSNHPTGVAVDPSSDRVFVDDRTSVAEYAPTAIEGDEPLRRIGVGEIEDGYGVAVSRFTGAPGFTSSAGWVYVADAADGTVKAFDPGTGPPELAQTIDGAGLPLGGFNDLTDTDLAVDARDGHVYVVDNLQPGFEQPEAVLEEFSSLGRYRGPVQAQVATGHGSGTIDAGPSSVAISASGEVFLTSGNYFDDHTNTFSDSEVQIFSAASTAPTKLLTATKSGAGVGTVFSSDPAGLRCGSACVAEFPLNRTIGLVAEPAPHSRFVGWTGCPNPVPAGRCSLALNADVTIDAEFEPVPQQALSVTVGGGGQGSVASAPAGIACGAACASGFDEGSQVTLHATPFAGSAFAGWSGCDAEPAPGACTVTMSGARAVTAAFSPVVVPAPPPPGPAPPRLLSVATGALGGASGGVTSAPGGIDCGATCAGLYGDGTTVTLEAHPAAGSAFLGWGGCDTSDGLRCTVALGADKVVAAAFGPGSPGPLRVRGVSVHGETATLRVAVPAPGELSAISPWLQPASALPIQAGVVALRLRLNPAGARALGRTRRDRLTVSAALRFAPFDGGSAVAAKQAVIFGAAVGSGRRRR